MGSPEYLLRLIEIKQGRNAAYNGLANFAKVGAVSMSTMNISLPEPLKKLVDEHIAKAGYSTSSEYVRELIRRDQDRLHLRELLLEGAASQLSGQADQQYFSNLRRLAKQKLGQKG